MWQAGPVMQTAKYNYEVGTSQVGQTCIKQTKNPTQLSTWVQYGEMLIDPTTKLETLVKTFAASSDSENEHNNILCKNSL